MNVLLNPTFWGSLFSLVIGLIILIISIALNGVSDSTSLSIDIVSLYSILCINLLFVIRYYFLIYLNAYNNRGEEFYILPKELRLLIFCLFGMVTFLCLTSVGAVLKIKINIALILLLTMSLSSLVIWVICWVLSMVKHWPKIDFVFGGAELVLLIVIFLTREFTYNSSETNVAEILPIFVFVVIFIFSHEFMKYYRKAIKSNLSELKVRIWAD